MGTQLETKSREGRHAIEPELQQKELGFPGKAQAARAELALNADAPERSAKSWAAIWRPRGEWERQAQSRVRATEARLGSNGSRRKNLFLSNRASATTNRR